MNRTRIPLTTAMCLKRTCIWLRIALYALIAIACLSAWRAAPAIAANVSRGDDAAKQFGVHEIVLISNSDAANPYEADVTVRFTSPSRTRAAITVSAFYDGDRTWRARCYVSEVGRWSWVSHSADDASLNDQQGTFDARPSNLRGKLRSHSKNRRWWATENRKTFLNLSDTAYILFRTPNDPVQPVLDETFKRYVKANVRLGITSMRAGGCGGYAGWSRHVPGVSRSYNRSNWCWQKEYTPSGSNRYWEQFDLDRFQTTDRRLEWLLNTYPDMYIQLIMGSKEGTRWARIPAEFREQTVKYMMARWAAWPQVYFQIVNDTIYTGPRGDANQEMVREIAEHMLEMDPFNTLRSAGAKRDVDSPFTMDSDWKWHTYFHTEETTEIDANVCDHYYRDLNVPVHVYHGEDIYEQDIRSVEAGLVDPSYYFRRLFWSVLLSGGSPAYGGRYPVLHPYDKTAGLEWRLDRNKLAFDEQLVGLDDIVHIKEYLTRRRIDLGEFLVDDAAALAVPAPTPQASGPSRAQCARRGRDEYVIYLPCASGGEQSGGRGGSEQQRSRGSCTVDGGLVPSVRVDLRQCRGSFDQEWYRATDGESKRGSLVEGGDFRTLTSPWKGADVILRLVKDQPRKLSSTDIVAIKGGRAEYPQSTLYAYERNLRARVSIDLDIRKTADGEIVVIHDPTTGRTCDEDWVVAEKTLAELKTLDAAYRFDPRADGTYPMRGRRMRLPSLDDALTLFVDRKTPGAIAWIDTKDDENYSLDENQGLYDRLIELLAEHNLWNEARIEVSSTAQAEALRKRDPRVRVVFWGRDVASVRKALRYPHYVRIGVPPQIAREVGQEVKDSGKELYVTVKRLTERVRKALEQAPLDGIGTENLTELFEYIGIAD